VWYGTDAFRTNHEAVPKRGSVKCHVVIVSGSGQFEEGDVGALPELFGGRPGVADDVLLAEGEEHRYVDGDDLRAGTAKHWGQPARREHLGLVNYADALIDDLAEGDEVTPERLRPRLVVVGSQ
jgi:hypothetical protein